MRAAPRFTAELADRVLRLTIANPRRLNAVDYDTLDALGVAVSDAGANPDVRAIVITGEGRAFCTGADLSATPGEAARGITAEMTMDCANRLIRAIVGCPVPVVARVKGAAAGVGVGIALAADLVYASEDTYFLLAFVNIGLMPDGGAAAMVAAAAGRPLANRLALLGERLPARDALVANMINAVLADDELDAHVDRIAARLAAGPRRALELTKAALNRANLGGLDSALETEKTGQAELLRAPDFVEGATAMLQKRPPRFAD